MNNLFVFIFLFFQSFCLIAQDDNDFDESPPHDSFYNGFNEGYIERSIINDVFWFDFDTNLSLSRSLSENRNRSERKLI